MESGVISPFERQHPQHWRKPAVSADPYQRALRRAWSAYARVREIEAAAWAERERRTETGLVWCGVPIMGDRA